MSYSTFSVTHTNLSLNIITKISYIHKESNHPPYIIKQVSFPIKSRLSSPSSSEKFLNESIPIYQEALNKI